MRLARWWLGGLILGCLLVIFLLLGHGVSQTTSRAQTAAAWMHSLDLGMPALWPSGTGLRAPQSITAAVVPRMTVSDMDMEMHALVMGIRLQKPKAQVAP
jgi:hypothetical protein